MTQSSLEVLTLEPYIPQLKKGKKEKAQYEPCPRGTWNANS